MNPQQSPAEGVLRRQIKELNILHQVASICVESTDEDELIDRITQLIGEAFYSDNFGVALVDVNTQTLYYHASYFHGTKEAHTVYLSLEKGVCGRVVRTGAPIRVGDVSLDPDYLASDPETRSEVCVPIKIGGRVIGVINAESTQLDTFSEEDERLLLTLAGQLATAISNARHLAAEEKRRKEAETLHQATAALTSSLDLHLVLDRILNFLEQVIPYDSACIFLVEGDHLRIVAGRGFPDMGQVIGRRYPAGDELFEKIRNSKDPLFMHDASRDERFNTWAGTDYVRGWMGVPLIGRDDVIGCLTVDSRQAGAYGNTEAALTQSFANQAATAIQNARLFEEANRQNRELIALYDTALSLGSVLEKDELLNRVAEQVYLLMAPDSMGIILYDHSASELEIALVIENGEALEEAQGVRLPLDRGGLTGWVMQNKQSLLIYDIQNEPLPVDPKHFQTPSRSWLGIPLLSRKRLLGVISVQSFLPHAFDRYHLRFMESVGAQVAVALENAELFTTATRRAGELAALVSLNQVISANLDMATILDTAYDAVGKLMDNHAFWIISHEQGSEYYRYLIKIDEGVKYPLDTGKIAHGIGGHCIQTGEPVMVARPAEEDLLQGVRIGSQRATESVLCVPLVIGKKIIGAMSTQSYSPNAFDEHDLELLSKLGQQVAIAIENARLFNETQSHAASLESQIAVTQQRVQELTMLFHVSQAIAQASLQSEDIIAIVARQFVEVLHVPECSISMLDPEGETLTVVEEYFAENRKASRDKKWLGKSLSLSDYPAIKNVLETLTPLVIHIDNPDGDHAELEYMREQGLTTLAILPLAVKGKAIGIVELESRDQENPYTANELNLATTLANQAAIAIENARLYEELEDSYVQTVLALARAMDARDSYTADHSQRLASWAWAVAEKMGCSQEENRAIHWAALLHDIGKIAIPDEILRKPGPLSEHEWQIMKTHPAAGAEIVAPVKRLADVAPLILAHQEHFDGEGYPNQLKGIEIPLGARILSVVDAYSAITDERVYRKARSHEVAIAELQENAGSQFDPEIVEVFIKVIEKEKEISPGLQN